MTTRSRLFHAVVVMGLSVGCGNGTPAADGGPEDAAANDATTKDAPSDGPKFGDGGTLPETGVTPDGAPCCFGTEPDGAPCPFPCYV